MNAGRTGKLHGEKNERSAAITRSAGILRTIRSIGAAVPTSARSIAFPMSRFTVAAENPMLGDQSAVTYPAASMTNTRGIVAMPYFRATVSVSEARCQDRLWTCSYWRTSLGALRGGMKTLMNVTFRFAGPAYCGYNVSLKDLSTILHGSHHVPANWRTTTWPRRSVELSHVPSTTSTRWNEGAGFAARAAPESASGVAKIPNRMRPATTAPSPPRRTIDSP